MIERKDEELAGRSDSTGTDLGPEVWRLAHPRHGALEVAVGTPAQLSDVDPGFPRRQKKSDDDNAADDPDSGNAAADAVPGPAAPNEGLPGAAGYVLLRAGDVVARARQIGNHSVSAAGDPMKGEKITLNFKSVTGPRVLIRTNLVNTEVRQVTFRQGKEVVHFDPPPGSEAEARLAAIAASPWKRVAYPVAGGISRSGGAIAMIILLPLIVRLVSPVIDWIKERMPNIDLPWPDISLPSIPWPDIQLPTFNLPAVALPGWVEFILEYSKVWIPLLVGVALAAVAVQHSRKSRRTKLEWEAEQTDEKSPDL